MVARFEAAAAESGLKTSRDPRESRGSPAPHEISVVHPPHEWKFINTNVISLLVKISNTCLAKSSARRGFAQTRYNNLIFMYIYVRIM